MVDGVSSGHGEEGGRAEKGGERGERERRREGKEGRGGEGEGGVDSLSLFQRSSSGGAERAESGRENHSGLFTTSARGKDYVLHPPGGRRGESEAAIILLILFLTLLLEVLMRLFSPPSLSVVP